MDHIDIEVTFDRPRAGPTYRPHLVCGDNEYLGVQFTEPREFITGVATTTHVLLMYPGVDYSPLQQGATFKVREGATTVGRGRVLDRPVNFE